MDFKKFGNFNWNRKIRIWIWHEQNESISIHFNPFLFTGILTLVSKLNSLEKYTQFLQIG